MMNVFKIGFCLLVLTELFSCDTTKVYEEYQEIAGANWQKENSINFEFVAKDTLSPHNLYINIRNTGNYPYSNIYLFVTMEGPNGNLLKDTVNCILADNRGKWLGKGVGDLWDLKMPYYGGFRFAQKGKYIVSFEQAMRVEDGLKGITDVGLRVEKTKEGSKN
ncbi:MAG: gliding motility lipoprotein GldH [Flavobacteriales bacterium CG_4_10_14_0_2_um_filter_32_8]|nr:MAG: gliding motility lipoprotein GldH [Flavobacteriales bacterium CG_4_10_14_0_2_um_filter_32_8]